MKISTIVIYFTHSLQIYIEFLLQSPHHIYLHNNMSLAEALGLKRMGQRSRCGSTRDVKRQGPVIRLQNGESILVFERKILLKLS